LHGISGAMRSPATNEVEISLCPNGAASIESDGYAISIALKGQHQ